MTISCCNVNEILSRTCHFPNSPWITTAKNCLDKIYYSLEREKELCELFRINEENKSAYISYNISRECMVIWVHFDKEDS